MPGANRVCLPREMLMSEFMHAINVPRSPTLIFAAGPLQPHRIVRVDNTVRCTACDGSGSDYCLGGPYDCGPCAGSGRVAAKHVQPFHQARAFLARLDAPERDETPMDTLAIASACAYSAGRQHYGAAHPDERNRERGN